MIDFDKIHGGLDDLLSSLARIRKLASAIPGMVKSTEAALAFKSSLGVEGDVEGEHKEEYIEGVGWEVEFSEDEWERLKKASSR